MTLKNLVAGVVTAVSGAIFGIIKQDLYAVSSHNWRITGLILIVFCTGGPCSLTLLTYAEDDILLGYSAV
jgi:hypothetical protein